jgi:anthranilate synthase component 2
MILLLDHDDSFVHTLADYLRQAGAPALVARTSDTTLPAIQAMAPEGIILSPGPGTPADAPLSRSVVHALGPTTPILGVCLGHQIIGAALGAEVVRAASPRHGMTSPVRHDGHGVLAGLPSPFAATRYHSLVIREASLPHELAATAWAEDDGELMGIRHRRWPTEGVQFHPEALLTEGGLGMIERWVAMVRVRGEG